MHIQNAKMWVGMLIAWKNWWKRTHGEWKQKILLNGIGYKIFFNSKTIIGVHSLYTSALRKMWKLLLSGCVTCVLDCKGWGYFGLKLINRIKWKHARDENVNQGLNSIEVGQHREKPWVWPGPRVRPPRVRPPRTLFTELLFTLILTRAFGNDA